MSPQPPQPPAPVLDAVAPVEGPGGTVVTLTGSSFGAQTPTSAVRFRVPGGPEVPATVTWGATSITATVPPLASFGSGGPLEVLVETTGGRSAARSFVLHEDAPPVAGAVAPAAALEGTSVTVTGSGFGRPV